MFSDNIFPHNVAKKYMLPTNNDTSLINGFIFGVRKIRPFQYPFRNLVKNWYTNQSESECEKIREIEISENLITSSYSSFLKTPRVLLGLDEKLRNEFPFLLEPFIITVNAFKKHCIKQLFQLYPFEILDFKKEAIIGIKSTFLHQTITDYENKKTTDYAILLALIYRLIISDHLLKKYQCEGDQRKFYLIQLFIDTHLDLLREILFFSKYKDCELIDPFGNEHEVCFSILDCFYPRDDRFFCSGDLFDITSCLDMGNAWSDVRPKGDNVLSASVHLFVCKNQERKCQSRNLLQILHDYFKKFPVLSDAFRHVILTSLLGNYPHAKHRPDIIMRMDIYKTFDQKVGMTDKEFFTWIKNNISIVEYCSKEFYVFSVEMTWALDQIFYLDSTWDPTKDNIKSAMNMMRAMLNRKDIALANPATIKDIMQANSLCMQNIRSEMLLYHEHARFNLKKSFKKPFIQALNKMITKVKEDTIDDPFKTKYTPSREYLQMEVIEIIDFITKELDFSLDCKFKTKWLLLFKVDKITIEAIRDLYFRFETKILNDTNFCNILLDIYKNDPIGFHTLSYYVSKLLEYTITLTIDLPESIKENQIESLRLRHKLAPWEIMNESYDEFYYCKACKNWISPHIPSNRQSIDEVYSLGLGKCIYDWNGKLFCKRESNSIVVKKLKAIGSLQKERLEPEEDNNDQVKKYAKVLRNYNSKPICRQTELCKINLLGKIVQLNNKWWVLCEVCAILTPFDQNTLSSNGLVCPLHQRDTIREIQKYEKFSDKYKEIIDRINKETIPTTNSDPMESSEPIAHDELQFPSREEFMREKNIIAKLSDDVLSSLDRSIIEDLSKTQITESESSIDVKLQDQKENSQNNSTFSSLLSNIEISRFYTKQTGSEKCYYCHADIPNNLKENHRIPAIVKREYTNIYLCQSHRDLVSSYINFTTIPEADDLVRHIATKNFISKTVYKSKK